MVNQLPAQRSEDARTDLMATLAAGRELGPEMDQALVESYLQRHPLPRDLAAGRTTAGWARSPAQQLIGGVRLLAVVAIVVAVVVASGGHALWLLWLLWLPLALGWWWRGGWPVYGRGDYSGYGRDRPEQRGWRDQWWER